MANTVSNLSFMDTKKIIGDWAKDCDFIKINKKEYEFEAHYDKLSNGMFDEKMIVTLGSEGCMYLGDIYETKKVEVRDVVGAGDTFLATLAMKYYETDDIAHSIKFANKCSTNVVTQKGVATPNFDLL